MKGLFLIFMMGGALASLGALAAAPEKKGEPAVQEEKGEILDIEPFKRHLQALRFFKARFVEVLANQSIRRGEFSMVRYPADMGKFWILYDPAYRLRMFTQGGRIVVEEDGERQSLDLKSTPVSLLLRPDISFTQEVLIKNFSKNGPFVLITFVHKDHEDMGELTLIFRKEPLMLEQWSVKDAQGNLTRVAFEEIAYNIPFPEPIP